MKFNLLTLACGTLSLLTLFSCGNSQKNFDQLDLIPVKTSKDGKWSMVNAKGEIVYDSEFDKQPSAAKDGVFSAEDSKGLFTVYETTDKNPTPVENLEGLKGAGYMEDGLMPVVRPKSRIEVVNKKGEKKFELTPDKGHEIVKCAAGYSEGMLVVVNDEDKYGYYDEDGKLAIAPKYESAYNFSEGLALVNAKGKDDSENKYIVIDKKGETVFKIKPDMHPWGYGFQDGYLFCVSEDRIIRYDKKGEEFKLPSKIEHISAWNDKYIIFSDEDYNYGIATIDGEILVRAKYKNLMFNGKNLLKLNKWTFFATKDNDDKEVLLINDEGEVLETLDYEYVINGGKFGYFAGDDNRFSLLNDKFELKCKEDFYEVSISLSDKSYLQSDYFDVAGIADKLIGMYKDNKIGKYSIGSYASSALSDMSPERLSYQYYVDLPSLSEEAFNYSISVQGIFSDAVVTPSYSGYYYWDTSYNWNSSSRLAGFLLKLSCNNEWGKAGQKALANALNTKGFKALKEGMTQSEDMYASIFKNGKIYALVQSPIGGTKAEIIFFDTNYDDISEADLLRQIIPITAEAEKRHKYKDGESSSSSSSWDEPTMDSAVADYYDYAADSTAVW